MIKFYKKLLPFLIYKQYVCVRYLKYKKEFRSKLEKNERIKDYKINNILDIEKIYNDFYSYVYTIIINRSKGYLKEEDVEEIISDTFFMLWKNTNKLEDGRALKPYIAGIAKNLIKEKIRKNNIYLDTLDYENKLENIKGIDFFIEEREEITSLKNSLKELKTKDKEVFELYYYQNRKIKEIALLLNISEFNVKQRLYRIRKKIKKNVEKKGGYGYEE